MACGACRKVKKYKFLLFFCVIVYNLTMFKAAAHLMSAAKGVAQKGYATASNVAESATIAATNKINEGLNTINAKAEEIKQKSATGGGKKLRKKATLHDSDAPDFGVKSKPKKAKKPRSKSKKAKPKPKKAT